MDMVSVDELLVCLDELKHVFKILQSVNLHQQHQPKHIVVKHSQLDCSDLLRHLYACHLHDYTKTCNSNF